MKNIQLNNTQSNNEAIELGFPQEVHKFRIKYSYYQEDSTKGLVRDTDTFCCDAPHWTYAVNYWLDFCSAEGRRNLQIEDCSEDTEEK